MFSNLLRGVVATIALTVLGLDPARAVIVYSQNFDGIPADAAISIANSGPTVAHPNNIAFSFIGAANSNALNTVIVEADSGNVFGAGATNQYLKYVDATSDPQLAAPAPLPEGTAGFQITADFYDPGSVGGTVRLGLSGASSGAAGTVFNNQTVLLFFNNGDLQAFHGTIDQTATGAYLTNTPYHLTVVGSYSGTQTYGSESVDAGTYDVWINTTKVLNNVLFRNPLTSSAGIGINNSNGGIGDIYFDNIVVHDLIPPAVLPQLLVDRKTGAVTLRNPADAAALDITGYSIGSAFGGLDSTAGWKTIANNYDGAGDESVDDGLWFVQANDFSQVSEMTFDVGATLAPNQNVVLSQGNGLWIPTYVEDLQAQVTLAGGGILTVPVVYTGNDGVPLLRGDLNGDGEFDATDYAAFFLPNFLNPALSGASPALRYRQGDLDGDFDVDIADFAVFRGDYDTAHGAGAFQAMAAGVPEPSALILLGLGLIAPLALRRRSATRTASQNPAVARAAAFLFVLLAAPPAQADTLGWWRLGDDDTPAPVNGAPLSTSVTHTGTFGDLFGVDPVPQFSNLVPGSTIRDPLANQKIVNSWSLGTMAAVNQERVVSNPSVIPTVPDVGFTIEAFVRFPDVSAAISDDFLLHRNNANGGWGIELVGSGNVHAYISSRTGAIDSGMPLVHLDLNSTATFTSGTWHHVALVYQGNSLDASSDMHLYVDYALQASGNVDDATSFGGHISTFTAGEIFGTSAVNVDEIRYTDAPLALDGSQFLRVVPLRTTINTSTGEIRLVNDTLQTFNLSSYQIDSPLGRLLTANGSWNSFSDQNLNPVGGGNDPGETWDESPNAGPSSIGETFLFGSTLLAPGGVLRLGPAYDLGDGEPIIDIGLISRLFDVTSGTLVPTTVQFVANQDGDFNGDGKVDAADYVLWRKNPDSFLPSTYETWRANFGNPPGSGSGLDDARAVPEPATVIIVLTMVFGSCGSRRALRLRRG